MNLFHLFAIKTHLLFGACFYFSRKLILSCLLCIACTNAFGQVTIGSDAKPNTGSLLDLKDGTTGGGGANASKGLILPRVKITSITPALGKLANSLGTSGAWAEAEHTGLMVYNVNVADACIGGADAGVYVWDGTQWKAIFSKAPTSPPPAQSTDIYTGANSYILEPYGKSIEIPVERAFKIWNDYAGNTPANGKVLNLTDVNSLSGALAANVVWQEAADASTSGVLDATTPITINGSGQSAKLTVKSGTKAGNALINVTIGGKVLWQWHIWVPENNPTEKAYGYKNGKYMYWFMDRYLGAINDRQAGGSRNAHGLFYQWGRPTPIQKFGDVATTTANSGASEKVNLTTAIQTPQFIPLVSSNSHDWYSITNAQWDSRWGNQDAVGSENAIKSPFDPCPYGWRVPSDNEGMSPWNCLTTPNGQTFSNGWLFNDIGRSIGYYAASGYRSNGNGSLGDVGNVAYVWTASPSSQMAHFLYFNNATVDPQFSYNRANGMAVRCIQE